MPLSKQPMFFNSSRNSPTTSTPATKLGVPATQLGAALVATLLTLLASTLALATSSDDATRVTGIRVDESSEGTRVILELSARAFYSFSNDANSATLALSNAALAAQLPRPRLPADSPITRLEIRSGSKPSISVDFRDGYSASVTALLPNDVHSQRLVLDIRNAYPQQLSLPPAEQKSNYYTIVIDPGHGGEDRGASLNGVIEKDVVLAVAQHLRQRLNEIDGVRALITRDRDKSLALLERRMFAAQNQADLFLSLHANSYIQDSRIQGAIVFGLADKGANSAFTRMLVAKENKADEYAALANYEDNNPHISRVLAELALGTTRSNSEAVGKHILQELGKITKLHSKKVQHANFVVLKSGAIPSLLIEMGFLSNAEEAQRLNKSHEQRRYAEAIALGVRSYLNATKRIPATPRLVAAQPTPNNTQAPTTSAPEFAALRSMLNLDPSSYFKYQVKRGDTLSGLASRHGISQNYLLLLNELSSPKLIVGQQLKLPRFRLQSVTVEAGDTLSEIALAHNASIGELMFLNQINSEQKIYRGQKLYVPKTASRYQAYIKYQVQRGDNLNSIAKRHGLSSAELMELNQLDNSLIRPNQIIKIPANRAPSHFVYAVKWGETLGSIAQKHGISVAKLSSFNGITDGMVYEGENILIPQPNLPSYTIYKVDNGDTISGIAQRFNIDVAAVQNINQLEHNDLILSGQQLKIPLSIR